MLLVSLLVTSQEPKSVMLIFLLIPNFLVSQALKSYFQCSLLYTSPTNLAMFNLVSRSKRMTQPQGSQTHRWLYKHNFSHVHPNEVTAVKLP